MMRNKNHHFLIVCFPSQGYINPSLQLANRLTSLGVAVTFATTVVASRRINKTKPTPPPPRLSFATFSDGFDDETLKPNPDDISHYFSELNRCGSQSLTNLITSSAQDGRPITFVIYSLLLSWAADVASTFGIASSLFFAQPATVLALYYYYFHGHGDAISAQLLQQDPSFSIQLPGLPSLAARDLPSFFSPSGPHAFIIPLMREQLESLGRHSRAIVLVNTFQALEGEVLESIGELKMVAVGPLIPRGSIRGDLFQVTSEDYMGWLSSKADSSVIYISFGSICVLSDKQEEEIMGALLDGEHTFLWVIRSKENEDQEEEEVMKKFSEKGKVVRWCDQVQVLSHPSLGCFMTHCGWNSTLESLVYGVPVVGLPQQVDQATNAKLVEDVWKTGVRVKPNAEGIVEKGEIRRCLDIVMGDTDVKKREEIEGNVKKWKELARESIGEGGSSDLNLQAFVMEIDGDGSS